MCAKFYPDRLRFGSTRAKRCRCILETQLLWNINFRNENYTGVRLVSARNMSFDIMILGVHFMLLVIIFVAVLSYF